MLPLGTDLIWSWCKHELTRNQTFKSKGEVSTSKGHIITGQKDQREEQGAKLHSHTNDI